MDGKPRLPDRIQKFIAVDKCPSPKRPEDIVNLQYSIQVGSQALRLASPYGRLHGIVPPTAMFLSLSAISIVIGLAGKSSV
ncbi:hypothetical protein SD51_06635 [Alicyclobacillus tengchongensis]|nr:hypothetical protein SD51_06635 [Alicyclobacillus tengchongensis]